MKILFFIRTLAGGGAERVLANLTAELCHRGHEITIAINENGSNYEIEQGVKIIVSSQKEWYQGRNFCKRLHRCLVRNWRDFYFTRKTIKIVQPNVIVTFLQCNMISILINHGNIPIVHSEHNAYNRELGYRNYFNRFILNRWYTKVCVLTPFDKGYANAKGLTNAVVMPNPNTFTSITEDTYSSSFPHRNNIMVCGRVSQWSVKGFDTAIKIFSQIAMSNSYDDLDIVGLGDTSSLNYLKNLATSLGVEDRVHFLGKRDDIGELMRTHKLLIMSSRTEGFPMVVTEAMTQGLPCVAFEGIGSDAIILNELDGIIVRRDVVVMASAIIRLLNDESRRYSLGLEALKNVERFSAKRVTERWENLFFSITNC